jgi:teichuronic acid biosynthesis glycosyltransferase TuaG
MTMELNDKAPLVSVITPLYNTEDYIAETIGSVLKQDYTNWEMIIVDDCSTDGSASVVERFARQDPRIRYFRLDKNYGAPYAARNFATGKAAGRFIAFLDSDDLWSPEKLRVQVSFMLANSYAISFTAYRKLYETDAAREKVITVPGVVNYRELLKTNHIGCLTAMYDVTKTGKLLQPGPQYHEDYIMWLQTLKKGFKAYGINQVLATYRVHKKSISTNKFKMAVVTWNIYRKNMKLNLLNAIWYFLHYSINGLKKV